MKTIAVFSETDLGEVYSSHGRVFPVFAYELMKRGKSVFILDMDILAFPMKWWLETADQKHFGEVSMIEYLCGWGYFADFIEPFRKAIVQCRTHVPTEGAFHYMKAWTQVGWYEKEFDAMTLEEAFLSNPLFLDPEEGLKARIQREYQPDYLLVHSRYDDGYLEVGLKMEPEQLIVVSDQQDLAADIALFVEHEWGGLPVENCCFGISNVEWDAKLEEVDQWANLTSRLPEGITPFALRKSLGDAYPSGLTRQEYAREDSGAFADVLGLFLQVFSQELWLGEGEVAHVEAQLPVHMVFAKGLELATLNEHVLSVHNEVLALDPLYPRVKLLRGIELCEVNPTQAVLDLLDAVEEGYAVGKAQLFLGHSYYALDQYEEAESAFQHALALDPKDEWTRMNLAGAQMRLGKYESAEQFLKSIRSGATYLGEYLNVFKAELCWRQGAWGRAFGYLGLAQFHDASEGELAAAEADIYAATDHHESFYERLETAAASHAELSSFAPETLVKYEGEERFQKLKAQLIQNNRERFSHYFAEEKK